MLEHASKNNPTPKNNAWDDPQATRQRAVGLMDNTTKGRWQ